MNESTLLWLIDLSTILSQTLETPSFYITMQAKIMLVMDVLYKAIINT